ncbi:VOC family protein [Granulicella sp. WH15]|uniref:VOC family protein n=1 Tax=Granulicella sp. WH15 TaxID=2602070 RepID=UPI001366BD1D|nr:VOC family protein [Granulicella sp. WH15]QHN04951.1 VOC family protein [Granulicella sp. WH15]
MARVTGIGGIFLRAQDPKTLRAWYAEHLGLDVHAVYGFASMPWSDELPPGTGLTTWSLFPADTKHFGDAGKSAMVNYRVDDLEGLLAQLREAGVPIDPKREDYSYGRFAWIVDPEGNRIELWEPLVDTPEE